MRTFRNSAYSIAGLVVTSATGLFYTPYLVKHLGVTSYGVVPLIMSLFVFATWISLAVNWSVGRYFTIAHTCGESEDMAKIFNTSFFASLVIFILIVLTSLGCAPFVGRMLRLPPGSEGAAKVLLICGGIGTGFGIISGVVEVGFFCLNRFDYRAIIMILRALGTVIIVLLMFYLKGPRLEWIGIGSCIIAASATVASYLWNLRLVPALGINIRSFSLAWLGKMISTNLWVVADQLGTIFMLNMNLLLANRLFGPIVSGEFALASQWETFLRSIMTALTVYTPTYVILVGRNDIAGLRETSQKASLVVAVLMAIGGGLMIGFSGPLVTIWLHRESLNISLLIAGLAVTVIINSAANPLYGVWQALNKIRIPTLATIIAGGIGISLTLLLAHATRLGPWSIVIGSGCAFTLRNVVFSVGYAGRLISSSGFVFHRIIARNVVGAAALSAIGFWLSTVLQPRSWIALAGSSALAVAIVIPLFWLFVLSGGDRHALLEWGKGHLTRILGSLK